MADPIPDDVDPAQVAEANRAMEVMRLIADDQLDEAFQILRAEFGTRGHAFRLGWMCATWIVTQITGGMPGTGLGAEVVHAPGADPADREPAEMLTATLAAAGNGDVDGCCRLWGGAELPVVEEVIADLLGLGGRMLREHIAAERARSN